MIELDIYPEILGRANWKTKEGWLDFVGERVPKPPRIDLKQYAELLDRERADYSWARLNFMLNGRIVLTPQVREISRLLYERVRLNAYKRSGKFGLIVAGAPNSGKTTTSTNLAKEFHLQRLQRKSAPRASVPIIYVCAPSDCTPKALLGEMLHFIGVPYRPRASAPELMNSLATSVINSRTELIIIDEVHNLGKERIGNQDSTDYLKQLSEKCPATFLYVGTDDGVGNLLNGPRAEQVTARFRAVVLEPYLNRTQNQRDEWTSFLESLEQNTGLLRQKPGAIVGDADLLYELSGGRIGDAVELVQIAAIRAMEDESEVLDFSGLRAERNAEAQVIGRANLKRAGK